MAMGNLAAWILLLAADPPATAPAGGESSGLGNIWARSARRVMIAIIFYFLLFLSAEAGAGEARSNSHKNLKKNDRVVTIGGIVGTIVNIEPESKLVTLKVNDNTRMDFLRSAIQGPYAEAKEIRRSRNHQITSWPTKWLSPFNTLRSANWIVQSSDKGRWIDVRTIVEWAHAGPGGRPGQKTRLDAAKAPRRRLGCCSCWSSPVIVVPFVLGSFFARALRMKDVSMRIGIVLFTLFLAVTPFAWRLVQGQESEGCTPPRTSTWPAVPT